jgi:hypothetical protein
VFGLLFSEWRSSGRRAAEAHANRAPQAARTPASASPSPCLGTKCACACACACVDGCVWKGPSAGSRRTTRIGIAVVVHRGLAGGTEDAAESWAPSLVQSLLVKHLGSCEKKRLLRCHWHVGPQWRAMQWAARRGMGFMVRRLGTRYGRTFGTDRAISEASLPGALVGRPVVESGGQWLRNGTALAALALLPLGTTPLCC